MQKLFTKFFRFFFSKINRILTEFSFKYKKIAKTIFKIFFEFFFFFDQFFVRRFFLQIFFLVKIFIIEIFLATIFLFTKIFLRRFFSQYFREFLLYFVCEIMYFAEFFIQNFAYCDFICFAILVYGKKIVHFSRHQKVQRSRINSFWIFFKEKLSIWVCFSKRFLRKRIKFATNIFFEKNLNSEKLFLSKKIIQNQKVSKTYFFMKRKLPKQSTWTFFFWKKFTEKNSFRNNISKLVFTVTVYYNKKIHRNFSKKLKKKISRNFHFNLKKKYGKKILQKKCTIFFRTPKLQNRKIRNKQNFE